MAVATFTKPADKTFPDTIKFPDVITLPVPPGAFVTNTETDDIPGTDLLNVIFVTLSKNNVFSVSPFAVPLKIILC